MDGSTLILFGIILVFLIANAALLWFLFKKRQSDGDDQSLMMLQNQIQELGRNVDSKIGETSKQVQESVRAQLSESARIVKEVTEGLTKLDETNRQVVSFADQLQNLQDILKNPKQRGVLGEYYLETVLQNVFPPGRFKMQYKFENGDSVDAVIFLDKGKILPIDSKFSLENYNKVLEARDKVERERYVKAFKQDLKNRIDETAKYIRPRENTMDFAFMFIPSEGVYYDLLVGQVGAVSSRDLIEYAFQQRKVIIVSPTSFMAYLQTVLQGLRSLQIEDQAQIIMKRVGELGRHIGNYDQFMSKLGNSLATTVGHYNTAHKELGKIDKDVLRITDVAAGVEPAVLEKPVREE